MYSQLINTIKELQEEINGATDFETLEALLEKRTEAFEALEIYAEENELDFNVIYDDIDKAMGKN